MFTFREEEFFKNLLSIQFLKKEILSEKIEGHASEAQVRRKDFSEIFTSDVCRSWLCFD